MRLIDADKLCSFLNNYPLEKAQSNFMNMYRDTLLYTFKCGVEAIPIEWIKKKYNEASDIGMGIEDWSEKDCYKLVLEGWEKENEANAEC